MQPDELIHTLLADCGNLAMPALAYGIMVRHIERYQRSLDAFLVEPFVRKAEIQRVVQEGSGRVSNASTVVAPKRRKWTPLQTVMWLALHADEDRAQELRSLGETYFENATTGPEDASGDPERLAVARKHALAFDRNEYEVTRSGDRLIFQQRIDPEVESALAPSNREWQRSMEAERLQDRYAERNDQICQPAALNAEELYKDIATARDLMADPPSDPLDSQAGPACVAAATLEGYFLDGIVTSSEDVAWATATLAEIVSERRDRGIAYDTDMPTPFWRGADRSAGRGLPLLLREDARSILSQLEAPGFDEDELEQLVLWLFTCAPIETRYAASRALDSVWQSPCLESEPCPHHVALGFVEESLRHTRAHRWQPGDDQPEATPLAGPVAEALAAVEPELVVLSSLNPSLRALGAEAGAATCVHERASELLDVTLEAHRRARQAIDFGQHTQWDALFAARAVLQQAAADNTSAVREYIAAFRGHFHGLWECLLALAAAAEESPQTAAAAASAWPTVIRDGLRFLEEAGREASSRDDLRVQDQVFAALLPSQAPDNMYAYREMVGDPVAWIAPAVWKPAIDQWVDAAVANHENARTSNRTPYSPARALPASGVFGTIDALVSMLHAPSIKERARIGIQWVERLVVAAGDTSANTLTLPEWLQDVRPHCGPSEREAWERIVDHLFIHGDTRVRRFAD